MLVPRRIAAIAPPGARRKRCTRARRWPDRPGLWAASGGLRVFGLEDVGPELIPGLLALLVTDADLVAHRR